jgi:DNA-binding CsgD family transcriptional regulator
MRKYSTEKEQILFDKFQIYRLAKLGRNNMDLLLDVAPHLPFYITLNKRKNLNTTYVSTVFQDLIETDVDELMKFGFERIKQISDKTVLERAIKIIDQYNMNGTPFDMCSYLQRIKFNREFSWVSTYKTIFDDKLYFNVGYPIERIGKPGQVLSNILDDVFVIRQGWEIFESLSLREKEILQLIAKGFSTFQVSEFLFLSEHTIKTHRKNISNKLGANNVTDWVRFAQALEMI